MRRFWRDWFIGVLLFLGSLVGLRAQVPQYGMELVAKPDPARVGSDVAFRLVITNLTSFAQGTFQVTAFVEGAGTFLSATNVLGYATNQVSGNGLTNTVFFEIPVLTNNQVADLRYAFRPSTRGSIQQNIWIQSAGTVFYVTNYTTRILAGVADLEVGFRSVPRGSLPGDLLACTLTVTNRGPDRAGDVRLTNSWPAGFVLQGVDPSGMVLDRRDPEWVILLGSLDVGEGRSVQVRFQPQASGTFPWTARAGVPDFGTSPGWIPAATTRVSVAEPGPGSFRVATLAPSVFSRQTGLMQQRIRVDNVGSNPVEAVRILVRGSPTGLYNAQGTNGLVPFVTLTEPLLPGEGRDLWLQTFNPSRTSGPDPELSGVEVPLPGGFQPETVPVLIDRVVRNPDGTVGLEFPTQPGRRYIVRFGPGLRAKGELALPVQTATANRVLWLDWGPPLTPIPPADAASRFYEVFEVTWP
ncbi:MAG: hypothetical protein ACKO3H_13620 [Verrucomicrobiota bacterium]